MLDKVSDRLRKCAKSVADRRRAMTNKSDIEGNPIESKSPEDAVLEEEVELTPGPGPGAPMVPGQSEEPPKPTAAPDQRAPRRQNTHRKKWNPDTRKPLMRGYMKEYRGTGKINERKPQTRGA